MKIPIKRSPILMLGILLVVHGTGLRIGLVGRQRPDDAELLFNAAARKFGRKADDLRVMRGVRPVKDYGITAASIASTLGAKAVAGQASYPEGTAVLFYLYEQGQLSAWLLTERGIRGYARQELPAAQLDTLISQLQNLLQFPSRAPRLLVQTDSPIPTARPRPLGPAVNALSAVLFPPSIGNALTSVRHLIVVPSLGIGTVPFALLRPFGSDEVMIDRMSVTIAPDLYDLSRPVAPWDNHFASPLVVGNPFLPPDPRWEIPPLPGAKDEALAVGKLLNVTPLLDDKATKDAVVRQAATADGLYFAAHGAADGNDPLRRGFLALTAADFKGGWWTAKEIQSTPLCAKLVVLAACQTGLGQVQDAGVIGLARAFHLAGVPRVVMSLWSVNDAATNSFMQMFMRNILDERGLPPAEALRQAMLETKRQQPDPSKWAAFMVFGTPR
jgi:hypothetical protein